MKRTKSTKRRMQAAVLLAVMLFTLITAVPATALAFDNSVKESVVVVAVYIQPENGEIQGPWWSGTGFFVGNTKEDPRYLLTNHHVVKNYINAGAGELTDIALDYDKEDGSVILRLATEEDVRQFRGRVKLRIYYSESEYDEVYIVDYNETKDVAILDLKKSTNKRHALKICEPTEKMVGSSVYVVGFPSISDNQWADKSKWGLDDMTVTKGVINRLTMESGTGVNRIQTDAIIQRGNSGGPMVNEKGAVVGINTMSVYTSGEGLVESANYAVNISEALPMLRNNNISFEPVGSGSNLGLIIGIVIAVVVVVAAVAVVLVVKKGKGKEAPAAGPAAKKPAKANGAATNPVIRSMSAQHRGMVYPVGTAPVIVGRDASSCIVVYKEGTSGVSGRHCSVAWDASTGEFILIDLHSSYGTFFMSGQRLEANRPYRVKPGTTFYVGDKANVLSVEIG